MKNIFRFYKTADGRWYIDLPEWGGSIDDLQMVEGADTMLDKVSGYTNECNLEMSDEPFDGADRVKINHAMWLCEVTVHVFHSLPTAIYISRISD